MMALERQGDEGPQASARNGAENVARRVARTAKLRSGDLASRPVRLEVLPTLTLDLLECFDVGGILEPPRALRVDQVINSD